MASQYIVTERTVTVPLSENIPDSGVVLALATYDPEGDYYVYTFAMNDNGSWSYYKDCNKSFTLYITKIENTNNGLLVTYMSGKPVYYACVIQTDGMPTT